MAEIWVDFFSGDTPPTGPVKRRLRNGMKVVDIENDGRWEIFNTTSDTVQYALYDPDWERKLRNWIKWDGTGQIPTGLVWVRLKKGRSYFGDARTFNWAFTGCQYDIVEYIYG